MDIDERIDKYMDEAAYYQEQDSKNKPKGSSNKGGSVQSKLDSIAKVIDDTWKEVKKYDKKNKTKIWNKISKDTQKMEGLVNDVFTKIIEEMK
jgi:hypothetical protein